MLIYVIYSIYTYKIHIHKHIILNEHRKEERYKDISFESILRYLEEWMKSKIRIKLNNNSISKWK